MRIPDDDELPSGFLEQFSADRDGVSEALVCFGREVIDVVASLAPAVKPQAAFFEQLGPAGMTVLADVIRYAQHKGLLVALADRAEREEPT